MNRLTHFIDRLEEHSLVHHKVNHQISNSSVGWHTEHSLKVITGIVDALEKSNKNDYKWKFNLGRYFILFINQIPRGKGEAPKIVVPEGEITYESLKSSIERTRLAVKKIQKLQPNNFFTHPYFGDLNLRIAKRFLNIHTNHHLKIISDINKKA